MDTLRAFISVLGGALLSIFYPIFNPMILLAICFAFDLVFGIVADRVMNGAGPNFSKFLRATMFLLFYISTIALIHLACYLQKDVEQGALVVKTVTYACTYFYLCNIFKNLHFSFPANRFFAFMYYVLSLDVITKRVPFLWDFLNSEKKNETNG